MDSSFPAQDLDDNHDVVFLRRGAIRNPPVLVIQVADLRKTRFREPLAFQNGPRGEPRITAAAAHTARNACG